ncbi:phage integrase [Pseudomonas capsici]|uniref:phage integrase n=1 Tax=Pseudomonas capsici TaxID=2810614 RepID=UPI0021F19751|nr:tyrosine-type recombinase/integrase [Pseudomonas capsici]MCV4343136.1 tyrosine-type recombinase/integrase [Pseudomonas capsici]
MRPRRYENRDLPPGMYRRKRVRKSGKVWVGYYYSDSSGKEIPLGTDLTDAKLKWAELEAKEKPSELSIMRGIFDRYTAQIIPNKAPRTQSDNIKELVNLRKVFDSAPIDSITPSMIAQYRDARTAKTRGNREIALLSHVFNTAREWGLTNKENPCQGVRKNKEVPRDFYASAAVWDAVYSHASPDLTDIMDLAYLTGQRPADVQSMGSANIDGVYLKVRQGKTRKLLRIQMEADGVRNALGQLIDRIMEKSGPGYFFKNNRGTKISSETRRSRWDVARQKAIKSATADGRHDLAKEIAQFQFRDIRPKAASEIDDISDASKLLGHSKEAITERVYRRVGAIAKPSK